MSRRSYSRIATYLVLLSVAAAGHPKPADRCSIVQLEAAPEWVFSGAWDQKGTELVLVDILGSALKKYSVTGEIREKSLAGSDVVLWSSSESRPTNEVQLLTREDVEARVGKTAESLRPTLVRSAPDGALFVSTSDSNSGPALWSFTGDYSFAGGESLASVPSLAGDTTLEAVYDFAVMSERFRLAFGDTRDRGGRWQSGVHLIDASKPSFTTISHFGSKSSYKGYYLVGRSMLCSSASGSGYALLMDKEASLLSVDSSSDDIAYADHGSLNLSEVLGDEARIDSADWTFDRSTTHRFGEAALTSGVAGLYCGVGSDESVYMLSKVFPGELKRASRDAGSGRWWLHRMSGLESEVTSLGLPIKSDHLVVIPGPVWWAFIAKGPVKEFGKQELGDIWLIPSSWMSDARSPLEGERGLNLVCSN